jgi:hypothetical protein
MRFIETIFCFKDFDPHTFCWEFRTLVCKLLLIAFTELNWSYLWLDLTKPQFCCSLLKGSIHAVWKCHNICCHLSKITLHKLKLAYHWNVEHSSNLATGKPLTTIHAVTKQLIIRWNSTVVCHHYWHKWLYFGNATLQDYYLSHGCMGMLVIHLIALTSLVCNNMQKNTAEVQRTLKTLQDVCCCCNNIMIEHYMEE